MWTEMIFAGDLNVNLERTGGWGRYEDIATLVAKTGLEDILEHFLLRLRPWRRDRQSWETVRQGRELRSWTDYILGSDFQIFRNMIVRYLRHNSDHFMVMGYLCGDYPNKHWRYLGRRTRLPLQLPGHQTSAQAENIFAELGSAVSKPD